MENYKTEIIPEDFKPWGIEPRQFITLMHLSQFAGCLVPMAGFILPIVMWSSFKDQSISIDIHGKNIINFMISFIIYVSIAAVLCLILIGFPILLVLAALGVILPIMGAIKSSNDQVFQYPATIQFLK